MEFHPRDPYQYHDELANLNRKSGHILAFMVDGEFYEMYRPKRMIFSRSGQIAVAYQEGSRLAQALL